LPAATLYALPASHPVAAVALALQLKGVDFRRVDMIPVLSKLQQYARFRGLTVPAIEFDDGEKVLGSREIVRALEHRAPDPPLLPADREHRAAVEEAERWGDEVLQDVARRIEVLALSRRPDALPSYMESSRMPTLPPLVRLVGPRVMRHAAQYHGANEQTVRADLAALPEHLDHVDELIGEGVIGGESPNAADLQIGSSLKVLSELQDVRPLLEDRPALVLGERLFPHLRGSCPSGALPATWLPGSRARL
jgi:glutathione S-transferase